MINKDKVTEIVEEWLSGKSYFLVDVSISSDDKIIVEIDDAEGVWIEDCVELSRFIESRLNRDVEEVDREILADYRVALTEQGTSMLRAFSHIFEGGYEAGYYSYKWAEMLEADAFRRFATEGIFNRRTGRDFRRCILSQGNSRPAAELFRDFMHRDPDPEALLRRCGIIA